MNTRKENNFDYKEFMKRGKIDQSTISQGTLARQKRREAAKTRITIRIDKEIIEQFRLLVPEGRGYQSLINVALREWLTARGVRELVHNKINEVVDHAVASIKTAAKSSNDESI